MDKEKIIHFLETKISEIEDLFQHKRFSPQFNKWKTETNRILEKVFGKNSSHVRDFKVICYHLWNFGPLTSDSQHEETYKKGLNNAKAVLQGIIDEIKAFGIPDKNISASQNSKGNTFNFIQNQSVNVNIEHILKNNLTPTQFEELNNILKENDKKKKGEQVKEFLKKIGESTIIEIIKSLLV